MTWFILNGFRKVLGFNMNNPWLVTIIGGIIVIIVGYYLFERRNEKRHKNVLKS